MTDLPAWCRPPATFRGRDRLVEDAVDATGTGPITLAGPPGAGVTTTAGAVVQRLVDVGRVSRAVAVRCDGCWNVSDAIRAIGTELRLTMPGDPATVRSHLRDGPPTAILIDDADLSAEATKQVLAITGKSPVIATGREGVIGPTFDVDPLDDSDVTPLLRPGVFASEIRGLPLLATLPDPVDPVDPWSTTQRLPAGSELLADIPMGLDDEGKPASDDLAPFLLPVPHRLVLHRSVREILGAGPRPSAETLAAVVRDRLPELHRVAADVDPLVTHDDIVLLRTAAEQIQEPDLRALAGAAAARMMVRAFQAPDALALCQVLLAIRLPPTARGLLRWVQGDAYVVLGSVVEAQASYNDAMRALQAANRADVVGAMARATAARFLVRGNVDLARGWMAVASDATSKRTDRTGYADTKRLDGSANLLDGDLDAALTRYAEASATLRGSYVPPAARALVAIGRAIVHISRGDLDRAADQLGRAEEDAGDHPMLVANIETLRAEAAVRAGHPGAAYAACERAAAAWRWTGDIHGLGRVHRLNGDAHALSGDRLLAVTAWKEAVRLAIRVHDLPLVRACLARIATVEAEGTPGPHVEEANAQLAMALGITEASS